jgi:hypothetical protein
MSYIYIVNYKDMRTTRLNENDLARIVRRALREEDEMGGGALPPQNNCFKNAPIPIPQSCLVDPRRGMIGTGPTISKQCLSDIGAMMTMKNLREVTMVLGCLAKHASTPIRY